MSDEGDEETVATYAPSYHNETEEPERGEEIAENIDQFEDNLPDIKFEVEMADGSAFIIDGWDAHALLLKHGEEEVDEALKAFQSKVESHYQKKTEPTKYGTVKWGESDHDESADEYDTHADLAPVVLYPHIRAPLMQLGLMAMSDEGEDPVEVIGIGDGEVSHYGEFGRVVVDYEAEN